MINTGEEIVAAYLEHIKGCDFIQRNLYTIDVQGEIDVVGIDLESKNLFVCEVAIHLGGLQYTKDRKPNNVEKLVDKFSKDISYANEYFEEYSKKFMLWSPVVRESKKGSKYNQMGEVRKIYETIKAEFGVSIELVINKEFLSRLHELREYARKETKELKSPIMRLLQIEQALIKHSE